MAPPAGFSDFYELELEINYNNSANPYLQFYGPTNVKPPQERQAGWTESYLLQAPVPTTMPNSAVYSLVQARASLLAQNFFIKKAIVHQASVFKSSFQMPGFASMPLFDSLAVYEQGGQYCSAPEETILLRLECGNLRRYEHQIRGLKDYFADDAMSYLSNNTSFANAGTFAVTSMFDLLAQSNPPLLPGAGTAAKITVSNSYGVISGPSISTPGSYPGVPDGVYPTYYTQPGFGGTLAYGTITMTGGAASVPTIDPNFQGKGYRGLSVYVPLSNDPYGLPNYQTPQFYWKNFMSCLIAYTGSGIMRRISQTTFTTPVPSFPSGLAPTLEIIGTSGLQAATRCIFQRVGNRQTGQIRLTKPARKRRGI